MILVRNHLQPLNGNKKQIIAYLALLLVILTCTHCGTTRKVVKDDPVRVQDEHIPIDVDTSKSVKIPSDIVEVDTPVTTTIPAHPRTRKPKLDVYLPFDMNQMRQYAHELGGRDLALLEYYVGFKLALDQLHADHWDMDVHIKSLEEIERLPIDQLTKLADRPTLIFGGERGQEVQRLAAYAQANKLYYMSGWPTSGRNIGQNEFYIQLNPGFQAHVNRILKDCFNNYSPDKVILAGKTSHRGRFDEINRLYQAHVQSNR